MPFFSLYSGPPHTIASKEKIIKETASQTKGHTLTETEQQLEKLAERIGCQTSQLLETLDILSQPLEENVCLRAVSDKNNILYQNLEYLDSLTTHNHEAHLIMVNPTDSNLCEAETATLHGFPDHAKLSTVINSLMQKTVLNKQRNPDFQEKMLSFQGQRHTHSQQSWGGQDQNQVYTAPQNQLKEKLTIRRSRCMSQPTLEGLQHTLAPLKKNQLQEQAERITPSQEDQIFHSPISQNLPIEYSSIGNLIGEKINEILNIAEILGNASLPLEGQHYLSTQLKHLQQGLESVQTSFTKDAKYIQHATPKLPNSMSWAETLDCVLKHGDQENYHLRLQKTLSDEDQKQTISDEHAIHLRKKSKIPETEQHEQGKKDEKLPSKIVAQQNALECLRSELQKLESEKKSALAILGTSNTNLATASRELTYLVFGSHQSRQSLYTGIRELIARINSSLNHPENSLGPATLKLLETNHRSTSLFSCCH
jgi:hypothetical protein